MNRISIMKIIAVILLMSVSVPGLAQPVKLAIPTAKQLEFQDMELGAFIHYSIDTYASPGTAHGATPASMFNPAELNTEQWVMAAKAMGATYIVLTARHEEGFCLWPTKTTDYSIKSSPYKNGKGDIVREFVNASRKHGLKVGLYNAPWVDFNWDATKLGINVADSWKIDKLDDPELYEKTLQKEKEQLRELMTNYGPLVFFWDDHFGRSDVLDSIPHGGKQRELYAALARYAKELQPDCLLLGTDIEHVGNENGRACYPFWNSLNTLDGTNYTVSTTYRWEHDNTGDPLGKYFRPQLGSNTNGLSTGGWMWTGPRKPQPLERRLQVYYETVGRGSGVIVNLTPDKRGIIPEDIVLAAKEMGDEISRRFSNPVAFSDSQNPVQILKFNEPETFNHVITMEDMHAGQKIEKYTIEAMVDGNWKTLVEGKTIGHKRIDQFDPVIATSLRFTVTSSIIQPAVMRRIALFNVSGSPSN